jgi:hypothetical protein
MGLRKFSARIRTSSIRKYVAVFVQLLPSSIASMLSSTRLTRVSGDRTAPFDPPQTGALPLSFEDNSSKEKPSFSASQPPTPSKPCPLTCPKQSSTASATLLTPCPAPLGPRVVELRHHPRMPMADFQDAPTHILLTLHQRHHRVRDFLRRHPKHPGTRPARAASPVGRARAASRRCLARPR